MISLLYKNLTANTLLNTSPIVQPLSSVLPLLPLLIQLLQLIPLQNLPSIPPILPLLHLIRHRIRISKKTINNILILLLSVNRSISKPPTTYTSFFTSDLYLPYTFLLPPQI